MTFMCEKQFFRLETASDCVMLEKPGQKTAVLNTGVFSGVWAWSPGKVLLLHWSSEITRNVSKPVKHDEK